MGERSARTRSRSENLAATLTAAEYKKAQDAVTARLKESLTKAGYPAKADMDGLQLPDGDPAADHPRPVRDDGLRPHRGLAGGAVPGAHPLHVACRLPYHIGNGWFGGFLPVTSFAIVAATGNIYNGLWYPIVVAVITLVIGGLFLRETKDSPA